RPRRAPHRRHPARPLFDPARLARAGRHRLAAARPEGQSRGFPASLDARAHRRGPRVENRPVGRRTRVRRVGIVAKPDAPRAPEVVTRLVDWLTERGIDVTLEKETAGIVPAVR